MDCEFCELIASAFGFTQALRTVFVFHPIYPHILGLSSRRVSFVRNTLQFHIIKFGLVAHELFTIPHVTQVQDVELVNV